jgi:hypothetical protein
MKKKEDLETRVRCAEQYLQTEAPFLGWSCLRTECPDWVTIVLGKPSREQAFALSDIELKNEDSHVTEILREKWSDLNWAYSLDPEPPNRSRKRTATGKERRMNRRHRASR